MIKNKFLKIAILLFIIIVNGYSFLGGPAKEQFATQGETKRIYRNLTKEIIDMGGEYKQFGGQVIRGFILEIDPKNATHYDEERIIDRIKELGFNEQYLEKRNVLLFCKEKGGILIFKKQIFTIKYESEETMCKNKK